MLAKTIRNNTNCLNSIYVGCDVWFEIYIFKYYRFGSWPQTRLSWYQL